MDLTQSVWLCGPTATIEWRPLLLPFHVNGGNDQDINVLHIQNSLQRRKKEEPKLTADRATPKWEPLQT